MNHKTCCICGSGTKGKQWWNRDTGYGCCEQCIVEELARNSEELVTDYYGKPGVHHSTPPYPTQYRDGLNGKRFKVRLIAGSPKMANYYLKHNSDCGVFDGSDEKAIVICENVATE